MIKCAKVLISCLYEKSTLLQIKHGADRRNDNIKSDRLILCGLFELQEEMIMNFMNVLVVILFAIAVFAAIAGYISDHGGKDDDDKK